MSIHHVIGLLFLAEGLVSGDFGTGTAPASGVSQRWVRAGEDTDIRDWLDQNPDFEPDEDGPLSG